MVSHTFSCNTGIILGMGSAIERRCYSVLPIYRGRVYRGIGYIAVACWTPIFWRPRARYLSRNQGNTLDLIRGDNCSRNLLTAIDFVPSSPETIFREINSGLPVNAGWNTCCAMVSQARLSIDTSIVSQSRVRLIIATSLEECVERVKAWKEGLESKGLHVNMTKTKFMASGLGLDILQVPMYRVSYRSRQVIPPVLQMQLVGSL